MEYYKLNILDIQKLFDNSELTSKELCEYYLERINKYNDYTNSISMINPDAIKIAENMDKELVSGNKRSLLHGIPVLIKDNINTHDKMKTTAGSIILKDFYASYDASIVTKLREAGAVILGKTNLSEFANFISWESKNGHSALKGQVLNPYNKDLDVGGSSSGSGSSMATSLAQIAIGTETSGSILSPSQCNSIVGVKPSVGWISRSGIIPISPSQDIPGPMTRNVIDAAILLNEMIGYDEQDSSTHNDYSNGSINIDNIKDKNSLKGAKLGVVKGHLVEGIPDEEIELFNKNIYLMKEFGASIIDVEIEKPESISYDVLFYEFPKALKEHMSKEKNAPFKDLDELMKFNLENKEERIPFSQGVFDKCKELNISEEEYLKIREDDLKYSNEIDKVINENNLDALLFIGYYGSAIAAKGGYPSVIVPCGYLKDNKPMGITFTSKKYSEEMLLKLAYSFEQLTNARKEPKID